VWRCQPVARTTSSTVAPSGRRSISITFSCFDGLFPSAWLTGQLIESHPPQGVNRYGIRTPSSGWSASNRDPRDGGSTVASVGDTGAGLGMLVVETIAKIRRAYFAQNKPIKTFGLLVFQHH
jgi:hypothetical protein